MIGTIGYLCLDVFPDLGTAPFEFIPGALREVGSAPGFPGGVIGNTGGALCRLQIPSRLGGVIGQDVFGSAIRESMSQIAAGSNLQLKVLPDAGTAYSLVLNPAKSDRMFLVCRGVNDCITSSTFGEDFLKDLDILHFGYPSLCQGMAVKNGRETKALFEKCHARGILTSLDLALPSPGTFSYALDWMAFFRNVLPVTDIFCPSIDEIRFMMKNETASPEEITDTMLALGAKVIFLKMGKEGMMIRTADTAEMDTLFSRFGKESWKNANFSIPPFPTKVVGTTGAGDSSIAGLLTGIYSGLSPKNALRFADRVAAYSISAIDSLSGIPTARYIFDHDDWTAFA